MGTHTRVMPAGLQERATVHGSPAPLNALARNRVNRNGGER